MRERLTRWLSILDLVIVGILWARGVLTNVLCLRQLAIKLLAAVPAIGLGEAVDRLGLFYRQGKLAEGCVCLLGVERLGQGRQICHKMITISGQHRSRKGTVINHLLAKVMGFVAFLACSAPSSAILF